MKYKLLKKIEGIDWEVGEMQEVISTSPIELHLLLLNGTIEKVEENKRWRADEGETYFTVQLENTYPQACEQTEDYINYDTSAYNSHNYFQTEAQAQAVANQIKELLIKSHANI